METKEVLLQTLHCKACGHKWIPRVVPVTCPRCKSYNYNKEKKELNKSK